MAVVKELIRTEESGNISFGNYELDQKSKVSDYQHQEMFIKSKPTGRSRNWSATECLFMNRFPNCGF